jgi:hypothetical protein
LRERCERCERAVIGVLSGTEGVTSDASAVPRPHL